MDRETIPTGPPTWYDRASAAVAITGFLLLGTVDAPFLDGVGMVRLTLGALGVGTLLSLLALGALGRRVLGPLWIGAVTAAVLAIPILLAFRLTPFYSPELSWALAVGTACFGLGVTGRSVRALTDHAGS